MTLGLILIAVGFIILFAEVFIPSGGLLAVLALCTSIAGVVLLYQHDTAWGVVGTLVVLFGGPISTYFLFVQVLPNTPMGKGMFLDPGQSSASEQVDPERSLQRLIGQRGTVMTALRPVGRVQIEDERFEAVSTRGTVDAGQLIEVIGATATELQVRPVPDAKDDASA